MEGAPYWKFGRKDSWFWLIHLPLRSCNWSWLGWAHDVFMTVRDLFLLKKFQNTHIFQILWGEIFCPSTPRIGDCLVGKHGVSFKNSKIKGTYGWWVLLYSKKTRISENCWVRENLIHESICCLWPFGAEFRINHKVMNMLHSYSQALIY